MSLRIASRCLLILLFSTVLSAQEPSGKPVTDTPKPRVIVIETTPDIERSEVLRKVIEALEKDGAAKRVAEDRIGKPVGYMAQINARPDTSSESLQQLIKALQGVGIEKFALRSSNEAESSVTITAPADASLRQARRIGEVLAKHPQFEFEFLEAANNDPVTPTSPQPAVFGPVRAPTPSPYAPKVPNKSAPSAVQYRDAPTAVPQKPSAVKIFALKNARAAAAARIIEQLYGRETSVAVDEQTNSLIVRGNEDRTQEIAALLTKLDAAVPPKSGSGAQAETPPGGSGRQTQPPPVGPAPLAIDFDGNFSQSRGFSFNVGVPQDSVVELRKRSQEFDQQTRQLAEQSKGPFRDPSEADKRKELLRATVQQAFAARQALLRAENSELVRRLHALQQSVEMRDRVSQQIIDRRVDELLNPDKQWNLESPAANAPNRETTAAESPSGDENKLVISRSETSVKVEGQFDGNEEVLLVIGDPRLTEPRATSPDLPAAKELKWASHIDKAGKYVIELRREPVKIDGGGMAPGLVFEVLNQPNTVQGTSYISFTDKDPLPNAKVVIAVPQNKVIAKRKSSQVLVTVGHVELPDNPIVVPINIVIRRKPTMTSKTAIEQPAATKSEDQQLGTVLGKPIRESDLNKNTSTEDNLRRLLLAPLTENYCGKHGLDRAEELNAKIKDENSRRVVRMFVSWWELNRHLYEKHGGRVLLSAFGSTAVDGLKTWLEEREQAGDFEITDPELKAKYRELWIDEPVGVQFAKPDQLKTAFDPAMTDRFIEIYAKIPAGVDSSRKSIVTLPATIKAASQKFPFEQVKGHIASIKQQTKVAEAVEGLRRITGLDFGDGVDRESRQAWLKWWEHESSCIDNAKDGVREIVVTGVITANGKPVSGANVQAHVPSKNSPSGTFQLAQTHSDSSGRYVLVMGVPSFAAAEESSWKATFTVRNPPHLVPDQDPIVMTLHRQRRDDTATGLVRDTLEKNNDIIFAGVPYRMNFKLVPVVKPLNPPGTEASPKTEQPAPPKPQDKLPDDKANDSQSGARLKNGQTKIAIGQILYSLPFSFPSVETILRHVPDGKVRPKPEKIECELVKYQVSDARHYPLVGPAQLVQAHFKSTITSEAGREVVYSDSSHLIRVPPE